MLLRAAVGTTSVNGVTSNTSETPTREPVMDWLHTLEKEPVLAAVNHILATLSMAILDRGGSRTICIDFMDIPFNGEPEEDDQLRRMAAQDGTTKCHRYCTAFVIRREGYSFSVTTVRYSQRDQMDRNGRNANGPG
jgi:hypothetical protein